VFDTTDRISHMFYRYLDPTHPANAGKDTQVFKDTIADTYQHFDDLLGRLKDEWSREDTLFMVISDHGFTNFRRGVNINTWLKENGYLVLNDGHEISGEWFEHVDWSRTKAFSLGLTGLFINRKGREASGIVEEGVELEALKKELIEGLQGLLDPENKKSCIRRVFSSEKFFDGPYRLDAPDLMVGYEGGYRNSWECATGAVTATVFSDNTKSWSGDHCVDPDIVPGVMFCNRAINTDTPRLLDIAPSVLGLFGLDIPGYMKGSELFATNNEDAPVTGMLDPSTLDQSGAAPGARIFPDDDAGQTS